MKKQKISLDPSWLPGQQKNLLELINEPESLNYYVSLVKGKGAEVLASQIYNFLLAPLGW